MDKFVYYIWLSNALGHGCRYSNIILEKYRDISLFYKHFSQNKIDFLPINILNKMKGYSINDALKVYNTAKSLGMHMVSPHCKNFPKNLQNIDGVPVILYYYGNINCFNDKPAFTIIGSRNATEFGIDNALHYARTLSRDFIIVSGLAVGCDSCAHRGALIDNNITVGIMACGLDINYPSKSNMLKKLILNGGGAIISEFPPSYPVMKENFKIRNRILSGISDSLLIIEAGENSGCLLTANYALEQGKNIFCLPKRPNDLNFQTSHKLIFEGAYSVKSVDNIYSVLKDNTDSFEPIMVASDYSEKLDSKNMSSGKINILQYFNDK